MQSYHITIMLPESVYVFQKYHFHYAILGTDACDNFIEALHVTPIYDVIII